MIEEIRWYLNINGWKLVLMFIFYQAWPWSPQFGLSLIIFVLAMFWLAIHYHGYTSRSAFGRLFNVFE